MSSSRPARRLARGFVAGAALAALGVGGPALADTPSAWDDPAHVSGLDFLIVLILIPAGLAILISVLVLIPGWLRRGEPGSEVLPTQRHEDL